MTQYAQWNGAYGIGPGNGFSNNQLSGTFIVSGDGYSLVINAYGTINSLATAYIIAPFSDARMFGCKVYNGTSFGFGIAAGVTESAYNHGGLCIIQSGAVYYGATNVFNTSATGPEWFFFINGSTQKLWVTSDLVNFYDGISTKTLSQVQSGVGGYSIPFAPPYYPYFQQFDTNNSTLVQLFVGQVSYPSSVPSGFSNLGPTFYTKIQPTAPGSTVNVTWKGTLSGTLQFATSANASTWTNCGGTNSGSSSTGAVATCGTATTTVGLTTTYYFRDSGNTNVQGVAQTLFVIPTPSGAGNLIAFDSLILRSAMQQSTAYPFTSGPYGSIYFAFAFPGGNYGYATYFSLEDVYNTLVGNFVFNNTYASENSIDYPTSAQFPYYLSGGAAATAPSADTAMLTGYAAANSISGSTVTGTATIQDIVNSTTTSYTGTYGGSFSSTNIFDHGLLTDPNNTVGNSYFGQGPIAFAIWSGVAPEALVITNASVPHAGTLDVSGTINNATLTSAGLSVDSGSFGTVTGLSVTGTTWSGSISTGTLTGGSHTVQAKDLTTSDLSNIYTFSVVYQTLTITGASGSYGTSLVIDGNYTNGKPTSMDYSLNGGSSFNTSTALTVTGSSSSGSFVLTGATLSYGNFELEVIDNTTDTESNIYDYDVAFPNKLLCAGIGS